MDTLTLIIGYSNELRAIIAISTQVSCATFHPPSPLLPLPSERNQGLLFLFNRNCFKLVWRCGYSSNPVLVNMRSCQQNCVGYFKLIWSGSMPRIILLECLFFCVMPHFVQLQLCNNPQNNCEPSVKKLEILKIILQQTLQVFYHCASSL